MALGDNNLGEREDRDHLRIDGQPVSPGVIEEVRTFDGLSLEFHAPLDAVRETLRPLREDAGSYQILERSDGGFVTVDTADGDNTHTVDVPAERQSLRQQRTYLVDDYDEEMLDGGGDRYGIELELVPKRSKRVWDSTAHTDDDRDDDQWLFEFDAATLATRGVTAEILESHDDGVETIGLELVAAQSQVRVIEESVRRLYAVDVTDQFDGRSRAYDRSPGSVNTVYLEPPDGGEKTIDAGHYAVGDWETEHRKDTAYEVTLDVLRIDSPRYFDLDYVDADYVAAGDN